MYGNAPETVIFDLDGTLVDTAPDLHAVLETVCGEAGVAAPPPSSVRAITGNGARALLLAAFAAGGRPGDATELDRLTTRFLEVYTARPCRHSRVFAGALELLADLRARGVRLAVCTNKPQRPAELLLDAVGLSPFFDAVVGGDVLPVRKPDPRHVIHCLERVGGVPERSVLVGDSANDVLAARAALVPCILLSHGYSDTPIDELGADGVADSFADLGHALARLATPA